MILKTKKKATIKMKCGRTFKAYIIGKVAGKRIAITSKEFGDMVVDSREVKN